MNLDCLTCGKVIDENHDKDKKGRPRSYCSDECRKQMKIAKYNVRDMHQSKRRKEF